MPFESADTYVNFDHSELDDSNEPEFAVQLDEQAPTLATEMDRFPEWPHHHLKRAAVNILRGDIPLNIYRLRAGLTADAEVMQATPERLIEQITHYALDKEYRAKWAVGVYQNARVVYKPDSYPDLAIWLDDELILPIEIKAWHVLSAEGAASFRFRTAARLCSPHGILVVYGIVFDAIVTPFGKFNIAGAYVQNSKHIANFRNAYWKFHHPDKPLHELPGKHLGTIGDREPTNDCVEGDRGNNFGRLARMIGLRDYEEFVERTLNRRYKPASLGKTQFQPRSLRAWSEFLYGTQYDASPDNEDGQDILEEPAHELLRKALHAAIDSTMNSQR